MTAAEKTNFIINEVLPYAGLWFLLLMVISGIVQFLFRCVLSSDGHFDARKAELEKEMKKRPFDVDLMIEHDEYHTSPSHDFGTRAAGVLAPNWIISSALIWVITFYASNMIFANYLGGMFAAAGLGGQIGAYIKQKAGLL